MNGRKAFIILMLLFYSLGLMATHQRAGEITYRHISGLTYEFTVTTYTYTPSLADRPDIEVHWGDGSFSTIYRNDKTALENNITLNTYIAQHTFPTSGNYSITFEDPNRNAGVVNIPNSVNIPFFLETILVINPFLGSNSSPVLLNPPIDNGCYQVPYYHNPGAYDADGDSLSYHLITCRGFGGENIPGYILPRASNSISIDSVTGELTWDSPTLVGEYNIAILIKEWRHGMLIGSIVRDMQISIAPCNNKPPEIITIDDTCVVAGTYLQFEVTATDETSTNVALSATGDPFQVNTSPAHFSNVSGYPPVTTDFRWATHCEHVRLKPYSVLFKAVDNGPQVSLSSYKTVLIRVIAPKPENLIATPIGNMVTLSWDSSICANATGYHVYKRRGSNSFEPEYCQTGMPAEAGYQLIGTNEGYSNTTFLDDGTAFPLYHGNEYCYRVVAFFADKAESYVSDEVCTSLFNDAPLITNVDVELTDTTQGEIFLRWTQPPELDTAQFPGPYYEYRIFRASSTNQNYQQIGTTTSLIDTFYHDKNLNSAELTYYYKVELWSKVGETLQIIETSDIASSIFINIAPLDRALRISWNEEVPWNNEKYIIYRYSNSTLTYDSLDMTEQQYYIDRNLQNGQEYCYYIMSEGGYYLPDTLYPLFNRSQHNCGVPYDNDPPEVPEVTITTDCEVVNIAWRFKSDSSFLDIFKYYIHYKPNHKSPYTIIDSIESDGRPCFYEDCSYTIHRAGIITGCFAISSADSNDNRSALSKETCFEYNECMDYRLPNIFTPNGDGYNDLFVPFPYSNVSKVNMVIYNRWGKMVFKTEDPDINWDGIDCFTHNPCPIGVHFYNCEVFINTLSGESKISLHGTVTLMRGE